MSSVGIKGYAYCLNHAPELCHHYRNTPYVERHHHKGESEFLKALPNHMQSFEDARDFAPNQAYIGGITLEEFEAKQQPWIENRLTGSSRYGKFGEIMPEDEFLGLIDICDVFDIIWLEKDFAASVKEKLAQNPVINEHVLARLETGHDLSEIENEVEKHSALPLYFNNKVVGCARSGHEVDECLFPYVLLEYRL